MDNLSCSLHGGRIWALARALGRAPGSILDFSANLNPFGPPQGVLEVYRQLDPGVLSAYPDTEPPELKSLLCQRYQASEDCLVLGHGGAALLMLAFRALSPKRVLVPQPCFTEQPRALRAVEAELVPGPMPDLKLDLSLLETRGVDAVLLTNPHNPTGGLVRRGELLSWIDKHPHLALVIDEAFMDYVPGESLLPEILSRPRTVVLRSLTKFYAMPGIRVGCAFADAATARRMVELQEGWPLGQVDILAAQAALRDTDYEKRTLEVFKRDNAAFGVELESRGFHCWESHGPFRLLHLPGCSGIQLAQALNGEGILIRTCRDWPGLTDSYLRLALREENDRNRLYDALKKVLNQRGSSGL